MMLNSYKKYRSSITVAFPLVTMNSMINAIDDNDGVMKMVSTKAYGPNVVIVIFRNGQRMKIRYLPENKGTIKCYFAAIYDSNTIVPTEVMVGLTKITDILKGTNTNG